MTISNLNVTREELINEYNKLSDEKLKKEVFRVVTSIKFGRNMYLRFVVLFKEVPLTRKQSVLFLTKFKTPQQINGYIFRHMLRCASHYGVPKALIKKYTDIREDLNTYNKGTHYYSSASKKLELKRRMHEYCNIVFDSTLELIEKSKSRKYKINTLMDKITEKVDK